MVIPKKQPGKFRPLGIPCIPMNKLSSCRRAVPLPPSAARLLAALPRKPGNPWVIPGHKPGTHMTDIDGAWQTLRERAGLKGVRLHDLRHSYASRALALGESLPMIGKLLGHSQVETTARYAHLARESVHEAAARIAEDVL